MNAEAMIVDLAPVLTAVLQNKLFTWIPIFHPATHPARTTARLPVLRLAILELLITEFFLVRNQHSKTFKIELNPALQKKVDHVYLK